MNEFDPKRCPLDVKMVTDIHTAVCGNPKLGINGLVHDVKAANQRISSLEETRDRGMTVGRASIIVGSFCVGLAVLAGAIISVAEFFMHQK
jgi:hypothetical protein